MKLKKFDQYIKEYMAACEGEVCMTCGECPCQCRYNDDREIEASWDREDIINTLMDTSNFELEELQEMTDSELKELYSGLETDQWLNELDREDQIGEAMSQPKSQDTDEYIGTKLMKELADELGTEIVDNKIEYEGKTINFYSETEKFHIDNKKFSTVEEVVDYLKKSDTPGEYNNDNHPKAAGEPQETEQYLQEKLIKKFNKFK